MKIKNKKARITGPRSGLASLSLHTAAASIAGEGGAPSQRESSVLPPRAPHHGPPAAPMLDPPPWSQTHRSCAGSASPESGSIHAATRLRRTCPSSPAAPPATRSNRGRGRRCGSERRHYGSPPPPLPWIRLRQPLQPGTRPLAEGGPCCPTCEPLDRALHHQRGPSRVGPPSLLVGGVSERREGERGEERGRER